MTQNDLAVRASFHNNASTFQDGYSADYSLAPSSLASEVDEEGEFPADVESLVYYFSVEIEPVPLSTKNYTFFKDPVRAKMILKFMKFYCWCPGLKGDPYEQRREQLKLRLRLRQGQFSQQLATFMSAKFGVLRDNGWISGNKLQPPVKYHEATDHWLEQSWDGIIRLGRNPALEIRSLKRAAPPLSSQYGKLTRCGTRSTINICTTVNSTTHPETVASGGKLGNRNFRDVHSNENASMAGSSDDASENLELVIHNLITPDGSINATHSHYLNSNNLPAGTSPTTTEKSSGRLEQGGADSCFDASELSALLERLSEPEPVESIPRDAISEVFGDDVITHKDQTRSSGIQDPARRVGNDHDAPIVNKPPQTLETLVKLERSCRATCDAIVAEKTELKSIHDQLSADNDKLYEEIRTFQADFKEADKRLKSKTSPTPTLDTSGSTATFHEKIPEIRRKLADDEWLESRVAAKAVLSQEIQKIKEKYKDLQEQHTVKAKEHQVLRATIMEEKTREKRRKTEITRLLENFERFDALADPGSPWISEINLDSDEED